MVGKVTISQGTARATARFTAASAMSVITCPIVTRTWGSLMTATPKGQSGTSRL